MNRRVALVPVCVLGLLLLARAAVACLWDYDTIMQERSRFPTALELITGKFLRHSPEFYRWRIADRETKLKVDPDNLGYYDDLAVAYSKIGDHPKAIELMLEKDRKKPGLYETYANLGTFYIFTGDLDQALVFINKALAINPNAHFGREKYQKLLVEYLLKRKGKGPVSYPLVTVQSPNKWGNGVFDGFMEGFEWFLSESELKFERHNLQQRNEAVQAVLGMMRFADHANPILLEALADLLDGVHFMGGLPGTGGPHDTQQLDAKQLAARALLKASYGADNDEARQKYRTLAKLVLFEQRTADRHDQETTVESVESEFQVELAEAEAWYASLRASELRWIQTGKNPDDEFARLYRVEPGIEFDASPDLTRHHREWERRNKIIGVALCGLMLLFGGYAIYRSKLRS